MIWFGVPGLLAGILSLIAPVAAFRWVQSGQDRIILFVATCSILPVALMFDTLMRLKQMIVFQLLFSCLAYVIIKELYRRQEKGAKTSPPET